MKIYIGNRKIEDESYQVITEPTVLNYLAEDAECTVIVFDGVLRRYKLPDVQQIIQLAHKKLRIGGMLKIVDVDFDLLLYAYQRNGNLVELNGAIFNNDIGSFLNIDIVDTILKQFNDLTKNSQRIQNIEFDMEFIRK